jgi:hypothetical protein
VHSFRYYREGVHKCIEQSQLPSADITKFEFRTTPTNIWPLQTFRSFIYCTSMFRWWAWVTSQCTNLLGEDTLNKYYWTIAPIQYNIFPHIWKSNILILNWTIALLPHFTNCRAALQDGTVCQYKYALRAYCLLLPIGFSSDPWCLSSRWKKLNKPAQKLCKRIQAPPGQGSRE